MLIKPIPRIKEAMAKWHAGEEAEPKGGYFHHVIGDPTDESEYFRPMNTLMQFHDPEAQQSSFYQDTVDFGHMYKVHRQQYCHNCDVALKEILPTPTGTQLCKICYRHHVHYGRKLPSHEQFTTAHTAANGYARGPHCLQCGFGVSYDRKHCLPACKHLGVNASVGTDAGPRQDYQNLNPARYPRLEAKEREVDPRYDSFTIRVWYPFCYMKRTHDVINVYAP